MWEGTQPVRTRSVSFSNAHDIGELAYTFRNTIYQLLYENADLTWVGFEDVRPVNKHHSEIHFGMVAILAEWAWQTNMPMCRATATQVKKKLHGSGKATKEEMLHAAQARFPHLQIANHDEADAVAVGLVVVEDMIDWKKGIHKGEPSQSPF